MITLVCFRWRALRLCLDISERKTFVSWMAVFRNISKRDDPFTLETTLMGKVSQNPKIIQAIGPWKTHHSPSLILPKSMRLLANCTMGRKICRLQMQEWRQDLTARCLNLEICVRAISPVLQTCLSQCWLTARLVAWKATKNFSRFLLAKVLTWAKKRCTHAGQAWLPVLCNLHAICVELDNRPSTMEAGPNM